MANFSLNVKVNGVEQSVSTIGQLEEALNATREELKGLEINSDAFKTLSSQARVLQGELENSFEKATNFNGSLDNITQSVGRLGSTIASSFAVVTAAFGIFGDESEDLTEAQIKAQQALAIAFGATTIATNAARLSSDLKNISNALGLNITRATTAATEVNTVVTATNTAAVGSQATATGAATVAQTGLNAAMAANPIGVVLVALTALVGAIALFSGGTDDATKEVDKSTTAFISETKAMEENQNVILGLIKSRIDLLILQEKDAEKRLALEEDLYGKLAATEEDFLEKRIARNKFAFEQVIKEYEDINKDFITETVETNEIIDFYTVRTADGFEQRAIFATKEINLNQDLINSAENLYNIKGLLALKELEDLEKTYGDKIITAEVADLKFQQVETQHYLKLLEIQETYLEQQGLLDDAGVKKRFDNQKKNLEEIVKQLEKDIIDQINLNTEKNKKIAEDENKAAEDEKKRLEEKQKRWKEAYDKIKDYVKDTYEELEKIDDDYYDKLADAQAKNDAERLQNEQIRAAISLENIRTNALKEIEASVLGNKEKQKAIDELEEYFKDAQDAQAEYFQFKSDEIVKQEQKKADSIKLINDILQQEISFGDQNTLDRIESLKARELELETLKLQSSIDNNQVRLQNFNSLQDQILESTRSSLAIRQQIEEGEARASRDRDLANLKENLEKEFDIEIDFELQKLNALNGLKEADRAAEVIRLEEEFLAGGERTQLEIDAFNAILQSKLNSEEEYLIQIDEIREFYRQKDLEAETNAAQSKRDLYAQYLSFASTGLQALDNLNQAYTNSQLNRAKGNADAEEKIRKESFKRQKALNIIGAVINGAQAVLQAIANFGPPPSPLGIAGIVAAGVLTASQIALIASQKYQSSSPSASAPPSPSIPSVGGSGNIADVTGGGFTGFNDILTGTPTGGAGQNPGVNIGTTNQRVYVVESDITNTQNRVQVLENGASFG